MTSLKQGITGSEIRLLSFNRGFQPSGIRRTVEAARCKSSSMSRTDPTPPSKYRNGDESRRREIGERKRRLLPNTKPPLNAGKNNLGI
ncbi:hypothetical protein KFK09_024416 [Dendrobium nobile]|uniref:Uncharacterized protein n=1 Tax=Dendrobium nobile TaxID=94219 RepID=A0A8T3AE09_DENNO|nr:hypothetical protein KFK09_024416 [Dendrobium nobile]